MVLDWVLRSLDGSLDGLLDGRTFHDCALNKGALIIFHNERLGGFVDALTVGASVIMLLIVDDAIDDPIDPVEPYN